MNCWDILHVVVRAISSPYGFNDYRNCSKGVEYT
nr:MAG TPA: hypothetical protein [Caudoviricetes sp.]